MKFLITPKIFLYSLFLILPSYIIGIAVTELLTAFLIISFIFINKNFVYFKIFKDYLFNYFFLFWYH